jgi:uncharacterized protein with HEPN domain
MSRDIKKYLYDVKVSIDSILEYIGPESNFEEYLRNKLLRRAVEREIEIIGEAINRALKIDPGLKLEHARRIVDTRNWVIHGYDKVDDIVVWGIINHYLPSLKSEVEAILES